MITIICGTNRKGSESGKFARKFLEITKTKTDAVQLLELEDIPHDYFFPEMYAAQEQSKGLAKIQDQYIVEAEKFLFVMPEYNGSFPGVLKLFLDACSIRDYQPSFKGKKSAMVGIATGRAGNLRGMDHLSGVMNHVGSIVMPNKLPISVIKGLMNEEGEITDKAILSIMSNFVDELIAF